MRLIGEYRERKRAEKLLHHIRSEATGDYTFMEVCGGHTHAIRGFGIPGLLPDNIRLISGPGCPVCVTSRSFIDQAISLAGIPDHVVASFGDLLRVPGSHGTLEKAKASGSGVAMVYSVNEAITMAEKNKNKKIIFLAIGFETTIPGNASGVLEAERRNLKNFFVLSSQKIMPPAMKAVVKGGTRVNGFICPGHVSVITGSRIFEFLPGQFGIGCVISGFEPVDILFSVLMLVRQVNRREPTVEVQYSRAVKPEGNIKAIKLMEQVFRLTDEWWRGFGIIPESGLQLKQRYEFFDARKLVPVNVEESEDEGACICGEILRGVSTPGMCPLFGTGCTPSDPAGACMVSAEGACFAYFKYRDHG